MTFLSQNRAALAVLLVFCVCAMYTIFISAPSEFPEGGAITIESGESIVSAGSALQEAKVVRSALLFSLIARTLNERGGVIANTYALPRKENVFQLAIRLTAGHTETTPVRVTIPEGMTAREVAGLLKNKLVIFDEQRFTLLGEANEGYLFPDTYYFLPGTSADSVVKIMRDTFTRKTEIFTDDFASSGKSLGDIIVMASILEREARKLETRKTVSGILWKRIAIGMPLQVDAVFGYILGKSGYAPTLDDFKIESPYNTYLNRGLPAGPISNPGLEAIDAALHPTKTPYLYYLTGDDGKMYYAKTFAEHVANRVYLK